MRYPEPDKDAFKEVILRRTSPSRVHFTELHIDTEVIKYFTEQELGREWVPPSVATDRDGQKAVLNNYIDCWHRLGYDCLRFTGDFRFGGSLSFASRKRTGNDTAALYRGKRKWAEEGVGVISSREEFENYQWPSVQELDLWPFEYASRYMPEGMGIFASFSPGVFEILSNELFGFETLSYLLHDDPELVKTAADRVGKLIYGAYERIIGLENLVGFFQADDVGFKTATLVSPDALKEYILPWHKRFARLAHEHGLVYILHNCGYCESIMEELIEEVNIDAKHSFEDEVMPVTEFKKKYGDRISVLGGVDVGKLCQLEEPQLREYVRGILDVCMEGGGYALGSGNSITNYMPIKNYLAMLDEGIRWGK